MLGYLLCAAALQAVSLKKYRKLHDMEDLPPGASKEEMIPAVAKHFSQQVHWLSSEVDIIDCHIGMRHI